MSLRRVASLDDLWSGEMMAVDVGGNSILLVNVDDHVYAYADVCPHQKSRLRGRLDGQDSPLCETPLGIRCVHRARD